MMHTERGTENDEKCVKTVSLNSNWVKNFNEVAHFLNKRVHSQLAFLRWLHELYSLIICNIKNTNNIIK